MELNLIPEEQVDQLEPQESYRPKIWRNRKQRRCREVIVEPTPIAQIEEVVEDTAGTSKSDARDVTRGNEINPPLRRVSKPPLCNTEPDDQPHNFVPVHTHPLTSAGVPHRTAEERLAWR
jgi:hypothetical protein